MKNNIKKLVFKMETIKMVISTINAMPITLIKKIKLLEQMSNNIIFTEEEQEKIKNLCEMETLAVVCCRQQCVDMGHNLCDKPHQDIFEMTEEQEQALRDDF